MVFVHGSGQSIPIRTPQARSERGMLREESLSTHGGQQQDKGQDRGLLLHPPPYLPAMCSGIRARALRMLPAPVAKSGLWRAPRRGSTHS